MRTLAKRQVELNEDAVASVAFTLRHWADWRSAACSPQLQHEALSALAQLLPGSIHKARQALASSAAEVQCSYLRLAWTLGGHKPACTAFVALLLIRSALWKAAASLSSHSFIPPVHCDDGLICPAVSCPVLLCEPISWLVRSARRCSRHCRCIGHAPAGDCVGGVYAAPAAAIAMAWFAAIKQPVGSWWRD
jgi:hypothetical protein